uniref:MarR family transcriptional regulator n=1 Tax=Acetatifactor sp. TaxID=1872090 RepID=UPI004057B0A1
MMNNREMQIINILSKNEGIPMMVTDIVNTQKDLTQSTVTAVLRNLLNKGLITVVGVEHSGRVLSRTYCLTEKAKICVMESLVEYYSQIKDIVAPNELYQTLQEKYGSNT